MILDILENAQHYLALNRGFTKAIKCLMRPDLKELSVDKYAIDEDRVYAMVAKDHGRKKKDALLETHKKYIDIQFILAGTDNMGWKPTSLCKQPDDDYNQETDIQFFVDEPEIWLSIKLGTFVIFYPKDAHMPLISSGATPQSCCKDRSGPEIKSANQAFD